ncbi:ELM1/GtrOC1 family putative glycosyltransferase [Nitratiruptor sp. YY09-18]|uniref:ELM1/GtrOC1 family putative glycosyltransferase n=1 Tax=Nitratiruptor sp. YY09-18 TaxID=2724901 RepID=UPI0019165E81|nr:ELM1/GtrOC1 family putative glycosyltransferase [Nitratiruptor sp. YY09-18]BCD67621.1 hypothetical protein NitYY0918_C0521 [Nitratiruptor sp. YY09-18]
MKILILSDGKKGHENQAIAYAKLKNATYVIKQIRFKSRFAKALSYLLDWLRIYTDKLFDGFAIECDFDEVVGAGSGVYYALKVAAKKCKKDAIALMQPKGYRKNFTKIYAPWHDGGDVPINFSFSQSQEVFACKKPCVALVVGGPNRIFSMDTDTIKNIVNFIQKRFPHHTKALTTSPRTPQEIEEYLSQIDFDYKLIYSQNLLNPIGDFLACCEYVFITIDSTSMISEAVSSGKACIEVVPLPAKKANKYAKMVKILALEGYVHIFDGKLGKACKKIDLRKYL